MGNCCASQAHAPRAAMASQPPREDAAMSGSGHSRPLRQERPLWNAPEPVTHREIMRQREEFWDTAPSFEGRREIWDALRAACESTDLAFAQAVIDSARIKLPTGSLTLAYDELGCKYTIPIFCISMPQNVVDADVMPEPARAAPQREGQPLPLKVRLSIGQDLNLDLLTTSTARDVKALVMERAKVGTAIVMVMFCGKRLSDMTILEQTGIAVGDVLQVMIVPRK